MKKYTFLKHLLLLLVLFSCTESDKEKIIDMEKVYAWCIVPFDNVERTPMERISMLKELGIRKYAYDWREDDLSTMAEELSLAKQNDIEIIAVWVWIDDNWDSVGTLNKSNAKVFNVIEEVGYQGQIWVSFNSNYFEEMPDSLAVKKGAEMIASLNTKAKGLGCNVALYNHGDWFGEPANQVKIIEALPDEDIGIVYNFHHAHHQIETFPEIIKTMMPYLWYVNLSGLRKEGPKILPIGEGAHEKGMIKLLKENGYKGDFGILGHVEDADFKTILRANLDGLKNKK